MRKYSFFNDYSEGAHPNILNALLNSNLQQESGYGLDTFCIDARKKILDLCKTDSEVFFVSGGTQANLICLSSMLRPHESVIAAETGHIAVHEAGAIEATGHKINTIKVSDGKLNPQVVDVVVKIHQDTHMVKPKIVFISNSTEVGTTYSKQEIEELYKYCQENNLYLYLDGARLGSALTASNTDLDIECIARNTDMFYIGGTKNGALLGEAIVINNQNLKADFFRIIKQRGGLLAKGRLLGIQFNELFSNNLFFELGRNANLMAEKLTQGIINSGFTFLTESNTNQIFPIFPNTLIEKLSELYGFYVWEKVSEEKSAIRLVTSWATKEESINEFLNDLNNLNRQ